MPTNIALPAHGLELIDQSYESAVVHLTKFDRLTQLGIETSDLSTTDFVSEILAVQ